MISCFKLRTRRNSRSFCKQSSHESTESCCSERALPDSCLSLNWAHLWIQVTHNISSKCCQAWYLAGILLCQLLIQGGFVYMAIISNNQHTLNTLTDSKANVMSAGSAQVCMQLKDTALG